MAFTFVNSIAFAPGGSGGTSNGVDMTLNGGADLLVAVVGGTVGVTETMSDSVNGSTWTALTAAGGGNSMCQIQYKWNASNGASQTFTVSNAGSGFPPVIVMGFNGSQTASDPLDVERHADVTGGAQTFQYGAALTPSAANDLFIAGIGDYLNTSASFTIDSGFVSPLINKIFGGGNNYQGAGTYKISTGSGSEQPTITSVDNVFQNGSAAFACFKANAGGAAAAVSGGSMTLMGCGM